MALFTPDIFARLNDKNHFVDELYNQYHGYAQDHGFLTEISRARLLEAHVLWKEDMARTLQFELPESENPDEYKQAGHLAYWLRRVNPYMQIMPFEAADTEAEEKNQTYFLKYGPHYAAFMTGFEICSYVNANAENSVFYKNDFKLGEDYFKVVSHFLKTKDVSPHSMYLIYKSIFLNPFTGRAFDKAPI